MEPEAVGAVALYGDGADARVLVAGSARKRAPPDVAALPAARCELIAPGVPRLVEATAGCPFPFRLGREPLAGPGSVSRCVMPGDVHHRVIRPLTDG